MSFQRLSALGAAGFGPYVAMISCVNGIDSGYAQSQDRIFMPDSL
jgi:hypothetical protein